MTCFISKSTLEIYCMVAVSPDAMGAKPPPDRIRWLAWWGQLMCGACLVTSLGTLVLALLHTGWRDHLLFGGMQVNGGPPLPLTEAARQQLVFILLPIVLCQAFAMAAAWRLFRGYRRGEIFTSSAAKRLSQIPESVTSGFG